MIMASKIHSGQSFRKCMIKDLSQCCLQVSKQLSINILQYKIAISFNSVLISCVFPLLYCGLQITKSNFAYVAESGSPRQIFLAKRVISLYDSAMVRRFGNAAYYHSPSLSDRTLFPRCLSPAPFGGCLVLLDFALRAAFEVFVITGNSYCISLHKKLMFGAIFCLAMGSHSRNTLYDLFQFLAPNFWPQDFLHWRFYLLFASKFYDFLHSPQVKFVHKN